MKLAEAMIAWTPRYELRSDDPTFGRVRVGHWPDESGWSDPYAYTDGMCMKTWRDADADRRLALLFILFNTMIIRDGIDPAEAHSALLVIDEYREAIPPDQPGADR